LKLPGVGRQLRVDFRFDTEGGGACSGKSGERFRSGGGHGNYFHALLILFDESALVRPASEFCGMVEQVCLRLAPVRNAFIRRRDKGIRGCTYFKTVCRV